MAIQEELKAQTPEQELEELYEEEPRRRPWGAIASVLLALAVIFVGYQWNQAASREQALASQLGAVRADAETLRLRAEDAQRQMAELQRRVAAVSAEKATLADRVVVLEKAAQERATTVARAAEPKASTAKAPGPRATPVVQKKRP